MKLHADKIRVQVMDFIESAGATGRLKSEINTFIRKLEGLPPFKTKKQALGYKTLWYAGLSITKEGVPNGGYCPLVSVIRKPGLLLHPVPGDDRCIEPISVSHVNETSFVIKKCKDDSYLFLMKRIHEYETRLKSMTLPHPDYTWEMFVAETGLKIPK